MRRQLADGQWYTIEDADADDYADVRLPDCRKGVARDPMRCPASLALRRKLRAWKVSVGARVVYAVFPDRPTTAVRFILPTKVADIIHHFDETKAFAPMRVEIRAPRGRQIIGGRADTKPGSNKRTGKARTVYNAALRHVSLEEIT